MTVISSTDARAALPELLDRVAAGEEVTITRHGRPVAVVVRPDALRARRAERVMAVATKVREAIEAGRAAPLSSLEGLSQARADDLVADVRSGRKR